MDGIGFRAERVLAPSGRVGWTVVDANGVAVASAEAFLRYRFACEALARRGGVRLDVISRLVTHRSVTTTAMTASDGSPLRFSPHRLRHTLATEMLNQGVSQRAIQDYLDHSPPT